MEMWIIITGSPVPGGGFTYYGPFTSAEMANTFARRRMADAEHGVAWTVALTDPSAFTLAELRFGGTD